MPVRILSVGTALPGLPVDTAALARCFGMNDVWRQWVDAFIGTRTRHLSVNLETGEQTQTLADLGTTAAENAMRDAGVTAEDIDVVVLGTATPDELMPATVAGSCRENATHPTLAPAPLASTQTRAMW